MSPASAITSRLPRFRSGARWACALTLSLLVACTSIPTTHAVDPDDAGSTAIPAEALNPDVRQDTIHQTICIPGYAASVRPSTNYTNGVKAKLLRQQELPLTATPEYELDHRIPLALGGHPRSLKNLELQAWEGDSGAKRKDRLERKLHQLVCAGRLQLDEAQQAMYFQWKAAFARYMPGQ